jgi:hypothetical protein
VSELEEKLEEGRDENIQMFLGKGTLSLKSHQNHPNKPPEAFVLIFEEGGREKALKVFQGYYRIHSPPNCFKKAVFVGAGCWCYGNQNQKLATSSAL